ncbi:MAG TPA: histidine kinase [Polyangia bacterium]|nr:histidine kinase [Polyangia bacterium]
MAPSPADDERKPAEYFLGLVRKETRGRLKVYLGMAAGVGKTYQMLREAHRLRRNQVDVVVAFVETHGRAETEEQIADLEVVPRKQVLYRGVLLPELDVDAVVRRRPQVAIVDELAHTNLPGASRHDKRYQDVEELLAAGIHVITAMNVQHLESLNDLVQRATGVEVRETVPDALLRAADEVVSVDVSPEDLQERLRAGKIYAPEKVERALANFFRDENLASLREIALREVADAAGRRAPSPPDASGGAPEPTPPPSATRVERVLVALSSIPTDARRLIRRGSRLAGKLNAEWLLLHVETPDESAERISAEALRHLSDNLEFARSLGARIEKLAAPRVAPALAEFARRERVTHVVFGRPSGKRGLFRRSGPVDEFMRLAPEIDVYLVGAGAKEERK